MRVDGISIRGMSSAVPVKTVRTADYDHLTPNERERFAESTGIRSRRIVAEEQCASDLCAFAADDIMSRLGWDRDSVGALILITQSPDYPVPATAIVLQHRLQLSTRCIAFDVNLGCSAYPYGVLLVSSLMKTTGITRALLLVGDVSSKVCHPADKSSWPLFGDAGTATALEADESADPMFFDLMNDGSGARSIKIPSGGLASRHPVSPATLRPTADDDGIERAGVNLRLRGTEIFSFAISKAPQSIRTVLQSAGWSASDVDYVVLHQANRIINQSIRKKLAIPEHACLSSLEHFGNTSSASIPLTLCAARHSLTFPSRIVMCGFGVGLSWGSFATRFANPIELGWVETDAPYAAS